MRALKHLALTCLAASSALTLVPAMATAQPAAEATAPAFDAAARREAIAAAAKLLVNDYVFPDVGQHAADMLTSSLAAGKYDAITTRAAFAAQVTKDLQALTHDKHLNVFADGQFNASERGPMPASLFGFAKADRLKGNIGYIVVNDFLVKDLSKLGADVAMGALASTNALIVDLRTNDGGVPHAVAYLVSFFVDSKTPVHINDIVWRKSGTTEYWREAYKTEPTPVSYLEKPVYVLVGRHTFSGGEEFAYDIQAMKRGTVIGGATKGGANPGGSRPIGPGLELTVPTGRGENPITGTNWEGKGVQPDIAIADDQSFATAYAAALKATGQKPPASAPTAEVVTEARHLQPLRTTAAPSAEAALRRLIAEMAQGRPPKDMLGYLMAWVADNHLSTWQADLTRLGALQSVTFVEVDEVGQDVYEARFANGTLLFTIAMQPDGKIALCWYRPK